MNRHIYLIGFILIFILGCSSTPTQKEMTAPAWTQQEPRTFDGTNLIYVGKGEDRNPQNSRIKAEAIALQDLANDCSLIPKGTQIQTEHFDETIGILFLSFAKISVNVQECKKAKAALAESEIRDASNRDLTFALDMYQKGYDAPEPEESASLNKVPSISNSSQLFVIRQQVALAKQGMILNAANSSTQNLSNANQVISQFEQADPKNWNELPAFSLRRPNAINHQAAAVLDTIAERARIQQQYPTTTPPTTQSSTGKSKRGGKHRMQQPQQP